MRAMPVLSVPIAIAIATALGRLPSAVSHWVRIGGIVAVVVGKCLVCLPRWLVSWRRGPTASLVVPLSDSGDEQGAEGKEEERASRMHGGFGLVLMESGSMLL